MNTTVEQAPEAKQPQTQGAIIDALHTLKAKRKALDAESKQIGEEMEALSRNLIVIFDAAETTLGAGSLGGKAVLTSDDIPVAEDWDAFYDYVVENSAMYLLHRRLSTTAIKEIMNSGETIPGLGIFTKRSIALK